MSSATAPHPVLPRYYDQPEQKRRFLRTLFDEGASEYNRADRIMALGTGPWYRRQALRRAGLAPGMRVLDVAVGTGLVAREAVAIVGDRRSVIGLDPSIGMISRAVATLGISAILGVGERLPMQSESVDFISMGYALRHVSALSLAFAEFKRVLKPGGRVCILEITRPRGRISLALLRGYMRCVVPSLMRLSSSERVVSKDAPHRLWEYYWDTIESCVPPDMVLEELRAAGFEDVRRHVEVGIFSEYTARKSP